MTDWTDTVKFILPFIPGVGIQNNIRLQYSTVLLRKKKGRRCVATKMRKCSRRIFRRNLPTSNFGEAWAKSQ